VVGDAADAALSYFLVIRPASKCNLPAVLIQRMLFSELKPFQKSTTILPL
jgi:hypothetical protein